MDRKWKLKTSDIDTDIYYRTDNEWDRELLFVDKSNKTVRVKHEYFEIKGAELIPQRETETSEWIKNSAKYGHWQMETGSIDLETARFILEILQKLESEVQI